MVLALLGESVVLVFEIFSLPLVFFHLTYDGVLLVALRMPSRQYVHIGSVVWATKG